MATNVVGLVVAVFIVAILASALLPTAFNSMFGANTSSWDEGTVAIWNVLPIIFIIVVLLGVLVLAGLKFTGTI